MAPDFLTDGGGSNILGVDRRLIVVVVVGVVAAGAAMAMLGLGGGGGGSETNAQLDSVPAGVDGVAYVDGNVTEDEMTLDMLDEGLKVGWWAVDNGEAPNISVLLETLDTENINYENTTVFLKGPEDGQADYAGSVVNLGEGSTAGDMVSLLEEQVGNLEEDTYSGVDVYKADVVEAAEEADVDGVTDELDVTSILREFVGVETTAWVATPDEDTVILGSEAAATDAIDVHQGEADPVDGDIRDAHENAPAGPVEVTVSPDIVDEPIVEVVGVVSTDAATLLSIAGHTPELLSVTYDVRDRERGTITFDVFVTMGDGSEASDLYNAMDEFADPDVALEDPAKINDTDAIDRAAAEQNGKYFHLEIPTIPLQTPTYLAKFVDEYARTPDPLDLVPEAADGIVQVDGNATDDATTADLLNESFAAGLVGDGSARTVADVREDINAGSVEYHSSTTFYGDDDYVATYVELGNKAAEDFITSDIRGQYRQRTGGDEMPVREDHKGYEHVDIYSTADVEGELNITRALSAHVADGTTEWVAPISNTSVLFGSSDAVRDAIDIFRGLAASPETPLHEAHNRTDGSMVLSSDVSDDPVDGYAGAVDGEVGDALAGQDPAVMSVAYDTGGDSPVTLDVQFAADDESGADDLADALGGVVDGDADGSDLDAPVHERAGLSRDGRYITLEVPYSSDGLVDDAAAFVDEFGTGPLPGGR